ncbi:MAG: ATP synthase F0 subunit C [Proteobacteria bacterium]|jgi:F-type H+-transporting ATPase subunit c|nr:ATP synthase F0 subunit C [Pseudomonadota bacterium]
MKRFLGRSAVAFSGLFLSSLAFAQDAAAAHSGTNLIPIGAGITMGLASFGAATAQGRTASTALEGIARNPSAKDALFQPFILGLVFMEFQALLGFVIAIIWTFK